MSPLAEFLKSLRSAYRLSQERFGRLMGLEGAHVCIIEKGQRYAPDSEHLHALADALKLTQGERLMMFALSEASPRKLRIPPNSPPSAFRLVALLEKRWPEFSEKEFSTLCDQVQQAGCNSRERHNDCHSQRRIAASN